MRRRRGQVAGAEVWRDDPWAVRMVDWLSVLLCYSLIGVPIGLPMIIMSAVTSERHVVIRVLAPLAAGAAIVTAFVWTVTGEGGGGGGGDYFDVCWDSPGGAYRC